MAEIKRGDIYLAELGEGVGFEQRGIRPVLVVQNSVGNRFSPTTTVLPITTKIYGKPDQAVPEGKRKAACTVCC